MKQVWRPSGDVLDIGCGGGASIEASAGNCVRAGKGCSMDLSEEGVAFTTRHNAGEVDRRCFIRQGDVCSLPRGRGVRCRYGLRDRLFLVARRQGADEVFRDAPGKGCYNQSGSRRDPNSEGKMDGADKGMTVRSRRAETVLLSQAISDIRGDSEKKKSCNRRT